MSTTPPDDDVATELVDLTESLARSPDASAEDFTGRRFGRFLLLRELGQGGMGRVFLAEQSGAVTRQVAIKIMRWRSPDPEHRLRFEMERQALARMRHPGIAQLFDAGATPEGELFFVMEYVRGVALNAWLSEHAPGLQTRIRILQEIGRALAHAHQRGLLHCDLKPSNVLITDVDGQPTPKLIDFGIARSIGSNAAVDGGTPGYMSPEQFERQAELDTRSDVYAMGVLMAELLSGQRFRPGLSGEFAPTSPPSARFDPSTLPFADGIRISHHRAAELRAIASRALSEDREGRYGSVQALVDDLQRWRDAEPVSAYGGGAAYRFGCFVRRNHNLSVAIVLALLVISALVWRLAVQLDVTRGERDRAEEVTSLLGSVFQAADPYAYPEGTVTARELLHEAPAQLQKRRLDPAVEQRLLQTVGDMQTRLELYADAEPSLARALELDRQLLGNRAEHGEAARLLARNALVDERYDDAATRVAAVIKSASEDQDDEALSDALVIRAELELYRGDPDAASAALDQLQGLLKGQSDNRLAGALQRYRGRVAYELGDYAVAASRLSEAIRLIRTTGDTSDAESVNTLSDLAMAQSRAGLLDEAEKSLREVVASTRLRFGENSVSLAIDLDNLGALLQRRGTPESLAEGEQMSRMALEILRQRPDVAVAERATAANNLSRTLELLGRPLEALAIYPEAVDAMLQAVGEDHALTGIVLHNRGRAELAAGELDAARESLVRSRDILAATLGEEHPRFAVWRVTEAQWALAAGDEASARTQLEAACATYRSGVSLDQRERQRLFATIEALGRKRKGGVVDCGIPATAN